MSEIEGSSSPNTTSVPSRAARSTNTASVTTGAFSDGARRGQVALSLYAVGHGARQPRFGLRHVRLRDLADVEALARRLQLLADHLFVVLRQLEHPHVTQHVNIGGRRLQQDLLLDIRQLGPSGADEVLGLIALRDRPAAAID